MPLEPNEILRVLVWIEYLKKYSKREKDGERNIIGTETIDGKRVPRRKMELK